MEVAFDDGSQILDKRFDLALCQCQLIQIYQPWNLALGPRAAGWKYLLEFIEFLKNYGSFKWQGNLFLREKWFYNVLWVLQLQFYNYNATPNSIPPRSWNLPDGSVNLQDGRREDCARSAHVRELKKIWSFLQECFGLRFSPLPVLFYHKILWAVGDIFRHTLPSLGDFFGSYQNLVLTKLVIAFFPLFHICC